MTLVWPLDSHAAHNGAVATWPSDVTAAILEIIGEVRERPQKTGPAALAGSAVVCSNHHKGEYPVRVSVQRAALFCERWRRSCEYEENRGHSGFSKVSDFGAGIIVKPDEKGKR